METIKLLNKSKTFNVEGLTPDTVVNFFKENGIDIINDTYTMYRYNFDINASLENDTIEYIKVIIENIKDRFSSDKVRFIYKETKNMSWGDNTFWLDYKVI